MNMLLELAINLIEHLETKKMIADFYFVTIIQKSLADRLPIELRAVCRAEIGNLVAHSISAEIALGGDACMLPGGTKVVDANVSLDRPSQHDLVTFKRYRDGHKFTAEENEGRPALSLSLRRCSCSPGLQGV